MEQPLDYLKKPAKDDWLIGYDNQEFSQLTEKLYLELIAFSIPPKIILAEPNPIRFLASFMAATAADCSIFLCNPHWVKSEWQQVFDLVQPDLIWGEQKIVDRQEKPWSIQKSKSKIQNQIMIPTGGSSGKIRFAIHTWETLIASVKGFSQYFQIKNINSFCVLPLYHVSGLMQFLRSFTTGGKLVIQPFKNIKNSDNFDIDPAEFFISLVPTQLQSLLQNCPQWLSQFKTVLLGGASAWEELLAEARRHEIPLALTYGMTETASQIVTLKPEEFRKGNNSCGQVLPHGKVSICSPDGEILGVNQTGIITIEANSLMLGYYPEITLNLDNLKTFQADDLGYFDEAGYLYIVGRNSNKIITGGENIFPMEIEAAIQATNLVEDVGVIGLPDTYWGQAVTAIYIPSNPEISHHTIKMAIEDKLSKFKLPKYWIAVEILPRNDRGKLNYEKLQQIAMSWLRHHPNRAANP